MRQPTILIPFFLASQIHVKIAKAYLQKKGTTTMKCASSAEADVFVQAVALCIAVTSPTVRRCDLPVWLLLRAATIAFATNSIGYTSDIVPMCITKSTTSICASQACFRKVHPFRWRLGTCLSAFCKHRPNPRLRQCLQEGGRLIPSICDSRM